VYRDEGEGDPRLLRPRIYGQDLSAAEDEAFDLVIFVADGTLANVEKITERLVAWSSARRGRCRRVPAGPSRLVRTARARG
jgi:hypothetical protein